MYHIFIFLLFTWNLYGSPSLSFSSQRREMSSGSSNDLHTMACCPWHGQVSAIHWAIPVVMSPGRQTNWEVTWCKVNCDWCSKNTPSQRTGQGQSCSDQVRSWGLSGRGEIWAESWKILIIGEKGEGQGSPENVWIPRFGGRKGKAGKQERKRGCDGWWD